MLLLIIAIEDDPLAIPFDGERCKPGIGNTGSSRFRLDAKSLEDIPVPLSRLYNLAMRLPEQIFAISERLLDRAGRPVDARIGGANTNGDKPKRASLITAPASHARQTACWGKSLRKA
jgi:hypothetical protein